MTEAQKWEIVVASKTEEEAGVSPVFTSSVTT